MKRIAAILAVLAAGCWAGVIRFGSGCQCYYHDNLYLAPTLRPFILVGIIFGIIAVCLVALQIRRGGWRACLRDIWWFSSLLCLLPVVHLAVLFSTVCREPQRQPPLNHLVPCSGFRHWVLEDDQHLLLEKLNHKVWAKGISQNVLFRVMWRGCFDDPWMAGVRTKEGQPIAFTLTPRLLERSLLWPRFKHIPEDYVTNSAAIAATSALLRIKEQTLPAFRVEETTTPLSLETVALLSRVWLLMLQQTHYPELDPLREPECVLDGESYVFSMDVQGYGQVDGGAGNPETRTRPGDLAEIANLIKQLTEAPEADRPRIEGNLQRRARDLLHRIE